MRRRIAIPALIVLAAAALGATSRAETRQVGNLRVTFGANFTPRTLPRFQPAPVTVKVHGKIATTDGSHPPPLRWLEVALNRNGRLYTKGLPICTAPALQSTSTAAARRQCAPAIVGRGSFRAQINLSDEVPVTGQILAFNGRDTGRRALLLHLFAGVPVRFTLVVPLRIGHREEGEFGTVLRARIPRLGGDLGSVTEIDLNIGRRYSFGGKRRSYLAAACGTPPGLREAIFPFARGTFRFQGHRQIGETLLRTCRVAS